mgnify:CR=1 FL=1
MEPFAEKNDSLKPLAVGGGLKFINQEEPVSVKSDAKVGVKIESPAEDRVPFLVMMLLMVSVILNVLIIALLALEFFNWPVPAVLKNMI